MRIPNKNLYQEVRGLEVKEEVWLVLALVLVLVVRKPLGKRRVHHQDCPQTIIITTKSKMIHLMKPIHWDQLKKIKQPSKPRYVNDKSSIFELRKRTIAILEWLGRSQVELQEEKQQN